MNNLFSYFSKDFLFKETEFFSMKQNVGFSGLGNVSGKALLVSAILGRKLADNTLWIVNNIQERDAVVREMKLWGNSDVFKYSILNNDDGGRGLSAFEIEREKRIKMVEFISRVNSLKNSVFVVDFNSTLQNFPNTEKLNDLKIDIEVGDDIDPVNFINILVDSGYFVTNDKRLNKGEYYKLGDSFYIFPVNLETPVRIDFNFDKVESVTLLDNGTLKASKSLKSIDIFPIEYTEEDYDISQVFNKKDLIIDDEIDVSDDHYQLLKDFVEESKSVSKTISFTSFNEDQDIHKHLHFFSVLSYRGGYDFSNDLRDKIAIGFKIFFFTKQEKYLRELFVHHKIPFKAGIDEEMFKTSSIFLLNVEKNSTFPHSFQNPDIKIAILNDTNISFLKDGGRSHGVSKNAFTDFLTGLKVGDYVVHSDHGIARFLGLEQKTVNGVTKEYLKLGYAENDKLFVPIDQADKVNKYIGSEELMPKLTRLGSAEWSTLTSKVKKETQKMAKELLKLYAQRKAANGFKFSPDNGVVEKFENDFPYDETPGQIKAIEDVKRDMERDVPMDRLICGDVGFGKTEVAMRAAIKAVQDKKQVAVISPITILTDQHYKSFKKRMEKFHVRVDVLSRFRKPKEQKITLEKLKNGEVDIIIGTHRLLQPDVKFKDLGLVVVDEEQRFGVKQKEKFKELRKEVDILTLTATPIPRTLNISLNKLRDITTITTPPFGRLPIITEVRKYSPSLVREVILRETERGGQVYFLHNRVQTIDSFADQLRSLVPEAKFCVAHGKLGSGDLEERIVAFKEGKYDVLVSSTIIENGIDLANANTLIVNMAEKFGLAQLYQLRGRVGRGKKQAYAYFLYHGQRLKLDAKKRLRAIVEASDLGSGFQIAMKDLEIRGAGDILGANQHGVINVVGMSHFMRMLNRAVEDLKAGRVSDTGEIEEVSVELPIQAFIPDSYIPNFKDKIGTYQKLSSTDSLKYLNEIKAELVSQYGDMPEEVSNLVKIIELKIYAKKAGVLNVKIESVQMSKDRELVFQLSKKVKPANIISLLEDNPLWKIFASSLKINLKDIDPNILKAIKNNLLALSKSAKHGA